jgi:hypothetical protein
MYGDFPAKNTVCTPYIRTNIWSGPPSMCTMHASMRTHNEALATLAHCVFVCVCVCVCVCLGVLRGCKISSCKSTFCDTERHWQRTTPIRAHMQGWPEPHIYTVYIRYFWQGNHQTYGHIRCIYTVLANPTHMTYDSTCDTFNIDMQRARAVVNELSHVCACLNCVCHDIRACMPWLCNVETCNCAPCPLRLCIACA